VGPEVLLRGGISGAELNRLDCGGKIHAGFIGFLESTDDDRQIYFELYACFVLFRDLGFYLNFEIDPLNDWG
jgi:hypothetical protein